MNEGELLYARSSIPDSLSIRLVAESEPTVIATWEARVADDILASTPELLETFRKGIPLGRLGTSEECAGAVLYLVSPLASYVTGQSIDINGGQWFA